LQLLALCITNWHKVMFYPNLKYNFSAVNIIFGLFGVAEMDNLNCVIDNFMK